MYVFFCLVSYLPVVRITKYVCCLCVRLILTAVQARKESGNDAIERESFNGEAEIETDQAYNDRNEDESELIGFPLKHIPTCMHPVDRQWTNSPSPLTSSDTLQTGLSHRSPPVISIPVDRMPQGVTMTASLTIAMDWTTQPIGWPNRPAVTKNTCNKWA